MARSRILKPEFLVDERLAGISPAARLYILGAASLADRTGVLENRPLRVRVASMPHDTSDPVAIFDELFSSGIFSLSGDKTLIRIEPWNQWFCGFPNEQKTQHDQSFSCGTSVEHGQAYPMLPTSIRDASIQVKVKVKDKVKAKERLAGFSEDSASVVLELKDRWPKVQRDGKPIRVDTAQFAARIDEILQSTDVDAQTLIQAGRLYLREEKLNTKAPQYFFGRAENQAPNAANWADYARLVIHRSKQEAASGEN